MHTHRCSRSGGVLSALATARSSFRRQRHNTGNDRHSPFAIALTRLTSLSTWVEGVEEGVKGVEEEKGEEEGEEEGRYKV